MLARAVEDGEIRAAIETWRADGFAHLPGVASEETIVALRGRAQALVAGTVVGDGLFFQPDTPSGRYEDLVFGSGYAGPDVDYRKIEKLERDSAFRAWLENPLFARIAYQVLGTPVRLYRATLFSKAAHRGTDLPWHQDGGQFWGLDRDPELQLWTALDDASVAAGCLTVLPSSHRAGLATPLGGIVPQRCLDAVDLSAELSLPVKAGDVLLLHNYLWHRSGPNRTAQPRRAFSVSLLEAATQCLRKKRAPRVFPLLFE